MWDNFCFYNSSDYFHSPRWASETILKICQNMPPTHTKFVHMPIFCGRGAKAISCWYQATTWYPSLIKISIYDVDFLLFSKNFAQFCQDIFSSCYSTRHIIFLPLYDNFWFLLTKIVRAWNTFSTAIFPPILHIHSVEQMTIAVSNFSFIMSLMTFFFDNESRGVAKPYYKSWKGGKGQKSISRIWRSFRAPISSKVLALKLKWNFQIRLYVHGKCLKYAHCTYFFHSVRKANDDHLRGYFRNKLFFC